MDNNGLQQLARKILDDGYLMSLGTADDGGVWVSDVIYVADEGFNLYWISMPQTRHSKAVESNSAAACSITADEKPGKERALQIVGIAEKIEGPLFEMEKKLNAKRGMEMPKLPGELLEDGHVWYVLRPSKIELIHSEHFGYQRQSVSV